MDDKIKWIIRQHFEVNKRYDELPYIVHLQGVVKQIKKYIHLLPENQHKNVIYAGWGHDTIEDTNATYSDVKKILGEIVAIIIFRLSNEKGKTRKERANNKYYAGIKEDYLAIYVKLCDRLANMLYAKTYGNYNMFKMYKKEFPKFKEKIYNGQFNEMWNDLEKITETKEEKLKYYYTKIKNFDKNTVHCIKLPKPIPADLYHELFGKGIIRKKNLIEGKYYYGKCRNAKVAVWNGNTFVYMRNKFAYTFPENIYHLEDDDGFDVFIPIEIVKPTEEEIITYK